MSADTLGSGQGGFRPLVGLRITEFLAPGDGLVAALVSAAMFVLFLVVYAGEMPPLVQMVRASHRRMTAWIGRRVERLDADHP